VGIAPAVLYDADAHEFGDVLDGAPQRLRSAGLFHPLAVEWRGGPHRVVSIRLAAKALGARPGGAGASALAGHARASARASRKALGRACACLGGRARHVEELRVTPSQLASRRLLRGQSGAMFIGGLPYDVAHQTWATSDRGDSHQILEIGRADGAARPRGALPEGGAHDDLHERL
jgi:hypothetical protein